MDYKLIFIGIILLLKISISKAQCTLTALCTGGNWSSASTWTSSPGCGTVNTPGNNMVVVIPACATVTVNVNSPNYNYMAIYVYGNLNFNNGQKINLDSHGYVGVVAGGSLTGGTPGSKININGTTVWNGPGPTAGPLNYGTNPLPIELSSFTASVNNLFVQLFWTTQSEKNNLKFEIERASDAVNFAKIGSISSKAINGNSQVPIDYSFIDDTALANISYYRLRQVNADQSSSYSRIISVNFIQHENVSLVVFPNPNTGVFTASISGVENNENAALTLYDQLGRIHYTSMFYVQELQNNKIPLVPNNNLPPGIYTCCLISDKVLFKVKVVVY